VKTLSYKHHHIMTSSL